MQETLQLSGATDIRIESALIDEPEQIERVDAVADLILLSRDALAAGLDRRLSRPERVRPWTYDFDPAGLELLRRAIEHVNAARGRGGASRPDGAPPRRRCRPARLPRPPDRARALRHR